MIFFNLSKINSFIFEYMQRAENSIAKFTYTELFKSALIEQGVQVEKQMIRLSVEAVEVHLEHTDTWFWQKSEGKVCLDTWPFPFVGLHISDVAKKYL